MLRIAVEACFASTSLVGYTLTHFTTHLHFPDPPLWDPAPARRLRLQKPSGAGASAPWGQRHTSLFGIWNGIYLALGDRVFRLNTLHQPINS